MCGRRLGALSGAEGAAAAVSAEGPLAGAGAEAEGSGAGSGSGRSVQRIAGAAVRAGRIPVSGSAWGAAMPAAVGRPSWGWISRDSFATGDAPGAVRGEGPVAGAGLEAEGSGASSGSGRFARRIAGAAVRVGRDPASGPAAAGPPSWGWISGDPSGTGDAARAVSHEGPAAAIRAAAGASGRGCEPGMCPGRKAGPSVRIDGIQGSGSTGTAVGPAPAVGGSAGTAAAGVSGEEAAAAGRTGLREGSAACSSGAAAESPDAGSALRRASCGKPGRGRTVGVSPGTEGPDWPVPREVSAPGATAIAGRADPADGSGRLVERKTGAAFRADRARAAADAGAGRMGFTGGSAAGVSGAAAESPDAGSTTERMSREPSNGGRMAGASPRAEGAVR